MSTIAIAGAHRSTRPLILTHWREMSRNRANFYFVLIFPFLMAGIFLGLNKTSAPPWRVRGPISRRSWSRLRCAWVSPGRA